MIFLLKLFLIAVLNLMEQAVVETKITTQHMQKAVDEGGEGRMVQAPLETQLVNFRRLQRRFKSAAVKRIIAFETTRRLKLLEIVKDSS